MNNETWAKEIMKYIVDKVPDIDYSTACEISEFITYKTANLLYDELQKRDREWQEMI